MSRNILVTTSIAYVNGAPHVGFAMEAIAAENRRVKELDDAIKTIADIYPVSKRLQQLRGVGPITATALVSTLSDGKQFAPLEVIVQAPMLIFMISRY